MRNRLPLIIIAMLLAGLVTFVVFQDRENFRRKLRKEFAQLAQGWDPVPVVVAARDVTKHGTVLTDEMIRLEKIPEKALQPYAVQDLADALGKEPLGPLAQGQQLLRNQLIIPGTASTSLATKIPPDKRAISIDITPITSVSGFIRPNDHVDILWTFALPTGGNNAAEPIILTLFQNVDVLAVGRRIRPPIGDQDGAAGDEAATITLALTPQEIELLLFAHDQGRVQFSLRPHAAGDEQLALPPVTKDSMLMKAVPELAASMAPPPPPVTIPSAPPAPPKQIEVIRGKERQTVTVSAEGVVTTTGGSDGASSQAPLMPSMPQVTPEMMQSVMPLVQQQLGKMHAQPSTEKTAPAKQ